MGARPIYISIMHAAEKGLGIHLSAEEVHQLSMDDAIATRAAAECDDDNDFLFEGFTWTAQFGRWIKMRKDDIP